MRLYQGLKESKGVSSKMISFGFRIKLLLAMLAVVGATTAVSLMVALQRVEAANDRLFRSRVNEQLSYLPREQAARLQDCLLYTSPSPRDKRQSRMPSSA